MAKYYQGTCEYCNREYKGRGKRFCSIICRNKFFSGKKSFTWKGKVKKKCLFCDNDFYVFPHERNTAKYCSKECNYSSGHTDKTKNKISKNHFYPRGKNSPSWKGGPMKAKCIICGKTYKIKKSLKNTTKFCSRECSWKWKSINKTGEQNHQWQGGISFEPYEIEFNNRLKEQIRERDNHICQECGYTQEQLGYSLFVHHIDYDKTNNNPNNLISLCNSCHAKTNFNRRDWTKYLNNKLNSQEKI